MAVFRGGVLGVIFERNERLFLREGGGEEVSQTW